MKKLFFIDFDNTIFSHQTNCVPQSALRALDALQKNGHKFILASGRDVCKNSEELSRYHLNPDGFISANGAMVEAEGHMCQCRCSSGPPTFHAADICNRTRGSEILFYFLYSP